MKNLFTSFLLLLVTLSVLSSPAIAVGAGDSLEESIKKGGLDDVKNIYDPSDDISSENLSITIARLIRSALTFVGIILIVLISYAGFMWMTAAGNDEQITKSKKIMTSAIIGLIIILCAYIISTFVIDRLLIATTGKDISGQ